MSNRWLSSFNNRSPSRIKKYYVAWDPDKISCFPFRHSVALDLLEPVAGGLESDLLYRDYFEMFRHQERDGIIDVFVPPQRYKENILILHGPVLKSCPTPTTKIRLVFNYSLKTSEPGHPFIKAVYQGMLLTRDLLDF